MAIINTIGGSGIQLTPLIPLLLTKWHNPSYSHDEQYWDKRSTTAVEAHGSGQTAWATPELIITDRNTRDAHLYTGWGVSGSGTYRHNGFIPLVDFSIEIYSTNSEYGVPLSSIQLVDTFTFKSGHPYDIVLPPTYSNHSARNYSVSIQHYNGSTWNNTLWQYKETNSWIVANASDGNTTIDLSFKAHILSPLIFKQPNYDL